MKTGGAGARAKEGTAAERLCRVVGAAPLFRLYSRYMGGGAEEVQRDGWP